MCLVPPARVIAVNGQEAAVELHGGMQATVSIALQPDVAAGHYVLVDRGLVIRVIDAAEAEAIIAMYDEIGDLLDAADERPDGRLSGHQASLRSPRSGRS